MSTQTLRKCSSESGRHSWKHYRNKVVQTQSMKSVQLTDKGIYSCTSCKLAKFGAPVYRPGTEGGAA